MKNIQAIELRIGNFLTSKTWKGIHDIRGIELTELGFKVLIKGYEHSFEKGIYSEMEGIPLTPEILEKCGAVFSDYEVDISGTCFELCSDGDFYYSAGEGLKLSFTITYLHQLQNLYHALTGTELSISL